MFNSYSSNDIKINAVSGGILKNHPKSWFEYFYLKSSRAQTLLCPEGKIEHMRCNGSYHEGITVLQMLLAGDDFVIAECVYTKDFEPTD